MLKKLYLNKDSMKMYHTYLTFKYSNLVFI